MLKFRKMPDAPGPAGQRRATRLHAGRPLSRAHEARRAPAALERAPGRHEPRRPAPGGPGLRRALRPELEPSPCQPGITGLSQLAFAREPEILDPDDREGHYVARILPQKIHMDIVYAEQRSIATNLRILCWTTAAVLFRRDVAVNRSCPVSSASAAARASRSARCRLPRPPRSSPSRSRSPFHSSKAPPDGCPSGPTVGRTQGLS